MKETLNLALRLALICAVAALALAQIDGLTREPIAAAEARAQREAVKAVLPAFAELVIDTLSTDTGEVVYYSGLQNGAVTGCAFTASTRLGYSGLIEIIVGVDPGGKVTGVRILRHAETPGLGANYAAPKVLNRFYKDRELAGDWKVVKDGGPVDAITGATITGRAIGDAIATGGRRYAADRDRIEARPAATAVDQEK